MLTRRDALAQAARRARQPAVQDRPSAPGHLRATAVQATLVGLAWKRAHDHGRHVQYEVFRDGRRIGRVRHTSFTDRGVRPLTTYRYSVRAVAGRRHGSHSHELRIRTLGLPGAVPAGAAPSTGALPVPAPVPAPAPGSGPGSGAGALTQAMVDRMFWRAGFGPSPADRQQWTGQPVSTLIDYLLTAPNQLAPSSNPPTYQGQPIDPLASDPELVMEWLDTMVRSSNPLVERMTFFWHRHFAVSRDAGIPSSLLLAYRDRLRRYADFSTNPQASFHDLALEMTTQDAAMSMYLTGFLNVKGSPNENYAREFMELFTLGVTNAQGQPNYSQSDVHALARAFTGYSLDQASGVVSFVPARFDAGQKTILGQTGAFDAPSAVALVLSQPSHGPFLVRKLWSEFIAAPIPDDALAALVSTYVSGGMALAPLLRGILSHRLMFDSLDEPAMIKPPVVYTVGALRAMGAPLRDTWQYIALRNMQQQPYHPPNVAGWEGGLSWMTSGTAQARFDLIVRCQGLLPAVTDAPGETPQQAFDRAYGACGAPWLSNATRALLLSYATQAPTATAAQRRERQYALCAFMLGGPDGQVS